MNRKQNKNQQQKNYCLLALLLAMIVLVYFITIVKLSN
jgi:predicted nucleic acid-binding Zn ribbon protein